MHSGGVDPGEKRFVYLTSPTHEVFGSSQELLVHCFHAFFGQRTCIYTHLVTPGPESRIFFGSVLVCGLALEYTARQYLLAHRASWVICLFRFFFDVQVIEIAEELVETMYGRKELVAIAKVVLAELAVM